jgi:dTDP-4-dehydrorhamnose reductase
MSLPRDVQHCANNRLELWGGIECTVNRVGDAWHDQLARSGHDVRDSDLDRIATLGLDAIRYPVVWERVAPRNFECCDWSWTDRRLARLRQLKVRPIAGLLHHGSGPAQTSLISDNFPQLLAEYAGLVAQRYPWLTDYTPVNEPLTTARFSALYGLWYPHERSDRAFVKAVIHQCRATVLAMRAVREVNSHARLVQTEDLGFIHSTPKLAYQAEFENHRRWLTLDLLCGRVDRKHPLWHYLVGAGAAESELLWFADNVCPPDVAGFNYYLTSERFLDERVERYPAYTRGSNGRHQYADIEAVRVRGEGLEGLGTLLTQAAQRYHLPVAVTEVHLGCHRESQLRWLIDAWQTAHDLRAAGINVAAITSWSLLGSYDWNSLCVRQDGHYESGAFDVRSGTPRPTAVAKALRSLARGQTPEHPAVGALGWWEQDARLTFPPESTGRAGPCAPSPAVATQTAPLMIVGGSGALGQAFAWACRERRLAHVVLSRRDLDITHHEQIDAALKKHRPWAVINAAGFSRVDEAEQQPDVCHRVNAAGPALLATACAGCGARLVTFSSDLVFDGGQSVPYVERDPIGPLCTYGRTQVEAERQVLAASAETLVIRTSALFGPWDAYNYLTTTLRRLAAGETVPAAEDWFVSPTYAPDLVHATIDLLIDGETGLWHLTHQGVTSWADFARQGAAIVGIDYQNVRSCRGEELKLIAPRPAFSALSSHRGLLLPKLADGLRKYRDALDAAQRHA